MRLLAIDASTWWGGAALLDGDAEAARLAAEIGLLVHDSHAARLLPSIDALFALAGWPKDSIDAYVAVRGPGSFTGIRVACGLVTGWALATGKPCLGIDTLSAMAAAWGEATHDRVPLLDAGRGEVYGARFSATGHPPPVLRPPWVGEPAAALEPGIDAVLFGNGARHYAPQLREAGYTRPVPGSPSGVAAGAARIALTLLSAGSPSQAGVTPLYLRPADAEVKRR